MLRTTIKLNHGIKIENYSKLRSFLKQKSEGFRPKKASTVSTEDINKFVNKGSDDKITVMKLWPKVNSYLMRRINTASVNSQTIITEKIGHVMTIGINRPEKRNCVDPNTAKLLEQAVEKFEEDTKSYVAVLYGTGGNFCSGFDLEYLSGMEEVSLNENMGPTLRHIKKPMVAALSGYAVAGGLELALMCDLRVMEETAVLGIYSRRFGVPLIDGGTVRLQAMVGLSRTLDLVLTGRTLDAKEAFSWGLANRIVACGTALGQAINLASSLVKFPQECLKADREAVYNSAYNSSFDELIEFEQSNGRKIIAKESIDGAKKFMSGVGRHGKTFNLTQKGVNEYIKFEQFNTDGKT